MGNVTDAGGEPEPHECRHRHLQPRLPASSGATHAAIFNGTSQYLKSAAAFGLVPWGVFGGGRYTFTGWFNSSTTSTQILVCQYDNTGAHGGWQIGLNSGGHALYQVTPSYTPSLMATPVAITTATLAANSWHFYAATLDGKNNLISVAVDGGAPATASFSGAVVYPLVPFTFGNNWNYPSTIQAAGSGA